ncbi:MAG: NAD(P)-dependent oxidoreductase [Puniceicoccaceae bacterium]|nr:MAG: NAD(P)-dependent oxidoreductase [Puniceicoccaceae bacterium]
MEKNVAVVGVGRMGANMARRLKDTGWTIAAVFDARREAALTLAAELKSQNPETLAAVTASAATIITVVSDDEAMRRIFLDPADNLLVDAAGRLFLNCATVSPGIHLEIEKAAAAAAAHTMEGCMASSITQAREGSLHLMCAGRREVYDQLEPLLKDLSSSRRYIGPAGSAAKVKALVNMVMNCNTAALAEGLGLGRALGLDLDMLREVFSQTGANSRVLETDGEDMQNRDHDCFFSAAHAAKDSGLALDLAKDVGLKLPLAEATLAQYRRMVELGLGDLDKSGVAELTFKGRRGA